MRFSAAVVVASSAVAFAQSPAVTEYATATHTIIDCDDDTPDCPGKTSVEYVPMTTSTVYEEKVHTIIDCGDDKPDCPAHSTIVVTETIPVSTTVCPVGPPSDIPKPPPHGNGTIPEQPEHPDEPEHPEEPEMPEEPEHPEEPEQPEEPEKPEEPECPSYTTTHITKEHVTTITTVETQTVEVPCPEETEEGPKPPVVTPPPHGGNDTIPKPPTEGPPPTEAGAAGLAGSAVFAAVAGFAAFILA